MWCKRGVVQEGCYVRGVQYKRGMRKGCREWRRVFQVVVAQKVRDAVGAVKEV